MSERERKVLSLDLVDNLRAIGFTQDYLALWEISPAIAYEISGAANLQRPNAYAAMTALEQSGTIQLVDKKPRHCLTVEPAHHFAQIQASPSDTITRTLNAIEMHPSRSGWQDTYSWALHGAENVRLRSGECLKQAEHDVWIKGPQRLIDAYRPQITAMAERGVVVRAIVIVQTAPWLSDPFMEGIPDERCMGNTVTSGDRLLTMIFDGTKTVVENHASDVSSRNTDDPAMVYVIETKFLHEVYLSKIIERFGQILEDAFGKGLFAFAHSIVRLEWISSFAKTIRRVLTDMLHRTIAATMAWTSGVWFSGFPVAVLHPLQDGP
jgi:sugar-specific transcriptional regulator TrmB